MYVSADEIKAQAVAQGFNLVGITRAVPSPTLAAYERWLEAGMNADMGYMAREDRLARRRNLNVILPNVQSLIVVGFDYAQYIPKSLLEDPSRGRIAAYAWGIDYHDLMLPKLKALGKWLRTRLQHDYAAYVDTGAILERSHAQQAGLGFIGKNTMLINSRRGSQFFIGEILTTAYIESDSPHRETMCGVCTRCLNACPTDAFPQPHVLDARRCISYHTIENKGSIPVELRANFGNWIYGCDVCQDVCPFQRFATPTQEINFTQTDIERIAPRLSDLLALDKEQFAQRFAGSAIARIKHERLLRNACVAAGNSGDRALLPLLEKLLAHENSIVQEHAAWGMGRLSV